MGSPNVDALSDYIKEQSYYKDYHLGVWNCRKIAGSSSWSQHSWGNAIDIMLPATANRKQIGDMIKADLLEKFGPHIRVLLWWQADHYDHIHVDLWPRGWSTPPCAGGRNTIMYDDGDIEVGPFPLTIRKEDEDEVKVPRPHWVTDEILALLATHDIRPGELETMDMWRFMVFMFRHIQKTPAPGDPSDGLRRGDSVTLT